MAPTKHRDDQLFTAPVEFNAQVTHDGDVIHNGDVTQNGTVTQTGSIIRAGRQLFVPAGDGVVGAASGWLVTGADDGLARLPAAETDSTLVVPIKGLHIGDIVQGVQAIGQVESAGADVTLIMSVRKATAAVADFVDAELDTDNVGTLTADTLIADAGEVLEVVALAETLAEEELIYILLTGTTAALTDIAISGFIITYDQV